jgi:hypothetical protein
MNKLQFTQAYVFLLCSSARNYQSKYILVPSQSPRKIKFYALEQYKKGDLSWTNFTIRENGVVLLVIELEPHPIMDLVI